MGINTASEIFQGALENALAGLKGVRNMWDDIIVFGKKDDGSHDQNLRNLLERLREKGLTVSKKRLKFVYQKLNFLGLSFPKTAFV